MEGKVMAGLVAVWAAYLPGLRSVAETLGKCNDMSEDVKPSCRVAAIEHSERHLLSWKYIHS